MPSNQQLAEVEQRARAEKVLRTKTSDQLIDLVLDWAEARSHVRALIAHIDGNERGLYHTGPCRPECPAIAAREYLNRDVQTPG